MATTGKARPETATANGNGRHPPAASDRLSEDALDVVDYFLFLWPTREDASAAAQAFDPGLNSDTWSATRSGLRDKQVVVVSRDTDEGMRGARNVAADCLRGKPSSVRIWKLDGYGSQHATMEEWCADNKLAAVLEMEYLAGWSNFVVFVGTPVQVCPEFKEAPRLISLDLLPVPQLELATIPGPLREWLADIANRGSFPLEYGAAAAIVAIAGLIGRRLAIKPKRHDDWLVVPNLWGAVVGPPGIQKTPSVDEALRPLKRLAADAMEEHRGKLSEWEARKLVATVKRKVAENDLKDAAKGKKVTDARLNELARLATFEDDESPPKEKRHLVNDVTVEKLGELLAENPNGLTLFRDELTGLLRTMDKQGHESDRGFLLECWNGNGSYTFDRIGRGKTHIPSACLSLFGTIQPGPLSKYLASSVSGEDADGFMPRFQILVYPDPPQKFKNIDRYPDSEAKNAAYGVFKAIDTLDPEALGCQVDADTGIPFLRFSDDAQEFFNAWRVQLEDRLRSGTLSNVLTSHLAKYRSLLPSLALIFHLVESYQSDRLEPVSLDAIAIASCWCELLEAHARRVYQAAMDGDPEDAIKLSERIKASLPNPFTYRQVAQKGWTGLSSVEDVRKAVGILEDRAWVKTVEVLSDDPKGRGRPSEQVWINPVLLGGNNGSGA
jgi:Protein of unknown function (DUF3987)